MATSNQGSKQGGSQDSKQSGQASGTSNRGFASMDPEKQREIASEGGKAAHEKGTAHEFTSEEARRAGSMSHGNRQSEQASSSTSADKAGASKQSEKGGSRDTTAKSTPQGGSKR
ncbi:MAG: KGG domain-containing protein [Pseudomonadota bacterium]